MNIREKVVVAGLPYIWFTNLTDDCILEFYELYANKIRKPDQPNENPNNGKVVFRVDCRFGFFDFQDGVCLWSANGEKHHILYRSNRDWELWNVRQQEIQELREEQAVEKAIEIKLLEVEDRHLTEKTKAAIKSGEYDIAALYVTARMDLRINSKAIKGLSYLWFRPSGLWWELTQFPTSNYGIEFLHKYDSTPQAFKNFAHWFAVHSDLPADKCAEQTRQIYEDGIKLFPNNACLPQAACLFWRRMKRYDLAMRICSEAIKKGMKDETKSGFEGRMKRLEKKSRQHIE
jgi:hypothetical protein